MTLQKVGQQIIVDDSFAADPLAWLAQQAGDSDMVTVLLHCLDGVAWGIREGSSFRFSHEVFHKELSAPTVGAEALLQARLFGPSGEIFLWRSGGQFYARKIIDAEQQLNALPDEDCYWLWGTGLKQNKDFTLLNEGQQGFLHAPPVPNVRENQRLGIRVRHYITEDETTGWQHIATSRLVKLEIVEGGA